MGWVIYNSSGEPLVTQGEHDHTLADGSGVLTDDEHDGYSEYAEAALPSLPAAGVGRIAPLLLTENDSLSPGTDETGLYFRRSDGHITQISNEFPYGLKIRYIGQLDEQDFQSSWANYNTTTYRRAGYTKDFLGAVFLHGMIKLGSLGANNIFELEEGWLSSTNYKFGTCSASAYGTIDVNGVGSVWAASGSSTWFSLDPAHFMLDGRMDWHQIGEIGEPAYENSWAEFGTTVPAFGKDALGRVWIKGLVAGGVNGNVFNLPVGYRPTTDYIQLTVGTNGLSRLTVRADGDVEIDLRGRPNTYCSIATVFVAAGEETEAWHNVGDPGEPAYLNGWVDYSVDYGRTAFYKDAAGVVHLRGLVKDGTANTPIYTLPVGYRPQNQILEGTLGNNLIGWVNIGRDGSVHQRAGAQNWLSVHFTFVAEQ